ncbi:MAG: DUF1801 domain-containing protein [Bacteroidota bacterium]
MTNPKLSDTEKVDEYISNLKTEIGATVQYLRQVILNTDLEIAEQIKWNSPSMYYKGEMEPFDPKTYKRDLVVFNLHKDRIILIFPTGNKINNPTGLLEGNYADGRRIVNFKNLNDAKLKEKDLQNAIKEWLKLVK